jgi:hypothetical protein
MEYSITKWENYLLAGRQSQVVDASVVPDGVVFDAGKLTVIFQRESLKNV